MQRYETKQRKRLFSFFSENPDRQFTIEELTNSIDDISLSAIYRNVNRMLRDGTIKRFQAEGQRKFLYQYVGGDCSKHLHLKCNSCGRIIHIEGEKANAVVDSVRESFDFDMDKKATMIIGECSQCK
ncbi:MAG: hypothetical protein GX025_00005 [Clostridiales bacterium]|jgi:Fur family ferric uptake transcriptional regulator|nr:hypothetical protein [Clostridiales bacterium]